MKVLSLFSGVGGFDMGLENAGMQTVFQCEWDKHANTILHKHWPTVPKWDDVSTLTGEYILQHAPVIDVVAWGSPCQDLSVAGKRAGLEGGRSGLFYEGMRIINELRKASNGKYPRISIWENVYGALNSNKGEDFEAILQEMVEAGSLLCEWRVLDAQYFGVPQRRRRVFVVAVFDPATAAKCPDPLLPVSESLRWNPTTRTATRQDATDTTSASIGSGGAVTNTISASLYHHGTVVNQDANNGHVVIEPLQVVGTLTVSDLTKQVNNEIISKGLLQVVEPFTSSSFAQYEQGVGTLRSNGGDLGGGSETLVTEPYVKSSRAQTSEDSETWVPSEVNPTLNSFDQGDVRATTAIVFENSYRDGARIANDNVTQTLSAKMGTGGGNTPMLAFDTQFGSNANVTENVAPTLKSSQAAPSVAYGIQGTMIGRQDHNGPDGTGVTKEDGPMFTLTKTDVHAVSQEEPTVFQPGTMIRLNGGVWEGTVPTLRAEAKRGDNEPHIQIHDAEPTMAVRRLTPLECERLMGWPDDHTKYKVDGTEQADTHRYKQCGNGVASPVAQWIGEQLIKLEEE